MRYLRSTPASNADDASFFTAPPEDDETILVTESSNVPNGITVLYRWCDANGDFEANAGTVTITPVRIDTLEDAGENEERAGYEGEAATTVAESQALTFYGLTAHGRYTFRVTSVSPTGGTTDHVRLYVARF